MAEAKEIKFKFVVDEASARQVHRVLDDLIKKAQSFAQALQNTGGGGGGGLLGGGTVGGKSPSSSSTLAKGGAAQNVSFAKLVGQNAEAFKRVAQEGGSAAKAMSDALGKSITEQQNKIFGLRQAVMSLGEAYAKVGASGDKAMGERLQKKILDLSGKIGSAEKNLKGLRGMQGPGEELMPEIPWPGAEQQKGGLWAALTKQREMPGMGRGSMLGQIGQGLGIPAGAMGTAAIAAVAVQAVKQIGNEVMVNPLRFSEFEAKRGQTMAGEIGASRSGDIRNALAMRDIMADQNARQDYQDLNGSGRRALMSTKEFTKGLFTLDFHRMGMAVTGKAADQQVMEEQNEMVQTKRKSDPLRDAIMGDITQGHMGRLAGMRALGISSSGGYQRAIQAATNMGFGEGELASSFAGIESGGTRRAGYDLRYEAMGAAGGGLKGAAGFTGIMSRFRGGRKGAPGSGAQFLRAAEVMGAQTDVAVADTTAQFVAQQAQQANVAGITGLGMMGMLGTGVGKGPEARMIADQNMRGAGALQNLMAGGVDSYQQARNLQVAIGAAPGTGVYAQDYLANKMNLTQMADILSGTGDLSPIAKSLGLGKEQVEKQFKGVTASTLERIINDPMMANSHMAQTMKSMQESGQDPRTWFKNQKGKKGFKQEEAIGDYGAFLMMSGLAPDEASAMGEARDIFGMGKAAPTKGRGVGAPGAQSLEMTAAQNSAKELGKTIDIVEVEARKLASAMSMAAFSTQKYADLSKSNATAEDTERARAILNRSIEDAAHDPALLKLPAQVRYNRAKQELDSEAAANAKAANAAASKAEVRQVDENSYKRG